MIGRVIICALALSWMFSGGANADELCLRDIPLSAAHDYVLVLIDADDCPNDDLETDLDIYEA